MKNSDYKSDNSTKKNIIFQNFENFQFYNSLKKNISRIEKNISEFSPDHLLGWNNIKLIEVHNKLVGQDFHTYIISYAHNKKNQYCLSYMRLDGNIVHVQFQRNKAGKWAYENCAGGMRISIEEIIKRIIHFKKGQPEPTPYIDSIYNK